MYDDWCIQHGDRVVSANLPLTAELCTAHRLDYSEHKYKTKRTKLGSWNKGVHMPGVGISEFALRAEERNGHMPTRRPAAKSVKIQ